MVILGIVGSPRKNGRTNRLVEAALEGVKSKEAAVKKIYLVDYMVNQFTGQGGAQDAYSYCQDELSQLCEEAPALIVGAPVYWGDINGLTKDFMDTVRITNSSGKPALGTAIAGGSGKGLLSGVQSIYHFFYHKQMRAIDPTPVSRFNFEEAQEQLKVSGAKLVDMANNAKAFAGAEWNDRWPEVLAYYTSIPYLEAGPLDEFLMLARQLVRISQGDKVSQAETLLNEALTCHTEGKLEQAARYAVRSYQLLFYPP